MVSMTGNNLKGEVLHGTRAAPAMAGSRETGDGRGDL